MFSHNSGALSRSILNNTEPSTVISWPSLVVVEIGSSPRASLLTAELKPLRIEYSQNLRIK